MQPSVRYTIFFAIALCAVCSVLVSTAAVTLADRQEANKILDQRKKVLTVAGLLTKDETVTREEVNQRFAQNLEARLVDLETGEYVEGDAAAFDQRKAAQDPARSKAAPANKAKVRRLPNTAKVFLRTQGDQVQAVVLPVEGMGLWSTLYGYVTLGQDLRTIEGIIFYEHGETPGLGGEVDNDNWKALWPGRLAFDDEWSPAIEVIKGRAGPVEQDPYRVDGMAGATLTSNGVTYLMQFWLGEQAFGPFLAKLREGNS